MAEIANLRSIDLADSGLARENETWSGYRRSHSALCGNETTVALPLMTRDSETTLPLRTTSYHGLNGECWVTVPQGHSNGSGAFIDVRTATMTAEHRAAERRPISEALIVLWLRAA